MPLTISTLLSVLHLTHIGIDLGTTNSLISVFEESGPRLLPNRLGKVLTPSVVGYDGKQLYVGETALARKVANPDQVVSAFKRTMGTEKQYKIGGKRFNSVELSSAVLSTLKQDAEAALGAPVADVVISVPAYFNEMQRSCVATAARTAGLNPVRLINEPTAAALAYGLQDLEAESCFLVFDLGGGTFDVSVLEVFEGVMEVKATSGDAFLGGEDFSDVLARHLFSRLGKDQQTEENRTPVAKIAEEVKRTLTEQASAEVKVERPGLTINAQITRDEFEALSAPLLKRLRRPMERVLHDARLTPADLEKVVLVGGATRMPVIRSMLARTLRHFPDAHIDPDHAVGLGAAVQAGLVGKNQALDDVVMTDVTAHSLGIETARQIGGRNFDGYFLPIVERNTVIPVSREETIFPLHPNQTVIEVNVYQGEAPDVKSNVKLGSVTVNLPRAKTGELEPVSVRFTYDVSGLLDVDITTLSDEKTTNLLIKNLAGHMSDADIEATRKKLSKLKTHPAEEEVNVLLRARIEQCFSMARLDQRAEFSELLTRFDAVLANQDLAEIERFREDIAPLLDRFEASYVL